MVEIEFISAQTKTVIQANLTDLFQVVINNYYIKAEVKPNSVYFLAKGTKVIPEKTVESYMTSDDMKDKRMRVLVDKLELDEDKEQVIIKSKDIICPKCKEPCRFSTENFQMKLFDCINNHIIAQIKIEDFPKTQEINISEIVCGQCKVKNKGNSQNHEFFKCLTCKINLCILCKSRHESEHNIIKYDLKNFICPKHNDTFFNYCKNCHCNICFSCDDEHTGHDIINLMGIKPDIKRTKEKLLEMKKEIDILINLKKTLNQSKELIEVINIVNIYYNINNDILANYEVKNRNYQMLQNLKEINNNNEILDALKKINSSINIKDIMSNILFLNVKTKYLNQMTIIYEYKSNIFTNKIKIELFGLIFVNNNKNNCYLVINGEISELCQSLEFNSGYEYGSRQILEIQLIEIKPITNMSYMFNNCNSLQSLSDISQWDTSNITDMSNMFNNCSSIQSLPDISKWDMRNVTNISQMFCGCCLLNYLPNISKWDTKNVTNISSIFNNCISLQTLPDISKWKTTNVNNMEQIFCNCSSLQYLPDISKWDVRKVKNMSYMFSGCSSLQSLPDISKWNTKNVSNMSHMFCNCKSLQSFPDISKWDTKNINNMSYMFYECSSYLPDISKWDIKSVNDMSYMFYGCNESQSLPDISKLDTKNVNNMANMFYYPNPSRSLLDISNLDTKKYQMYQKMIEEQKQQQMHQQLHQQMMQQQILQQQMMQQQMMQQQMMHKSKIDIEDEIREKQTFLKEEIINKNYDATSFINFCRSKKESGDDINSWTWDELKEIVNEFQIKNNKFQIQNEVKIKKNQMNQKMIQERDPQPKPTPKQEQKPVEKHQPKADRQQELPNEYGICVIFRDDIVNDSIMIQAMPDEKVSSIMKKFKVKSGREKLKDRFIFNSKDLNPNLTVAEAGISNNNANIFVEAKSKCIIF